MATFAFDSLPMEMKEMVLAKVDPVDSLKLLQANRQLRNYTLFYGPWHNKIVNELKVKLSISNKSIVGSYFLEDLANCLPSIMEFQVLNRLANSIGSARSLWLNVVDLSNARLKLPLSAILTKCPVLHKCLLIVDSSSQICDLFDLCHPRILRCFFFNIKDRYIRAPAEKDALFVILRVMLTDCRSVELLKTTTFLFELLSELNVRRISVIDVVSNLWGTLMYTDDLHSKIEKVLSEGIPSRHPRAEFCYYKKRFHLYGASWVQSSFKKPWVGEAPSPGFVEFFKRFVPGQTFESSRFFCYLAVGPKKIALLLHDPGIDDELMHFYAVNIPC